MGRDAEQRVVFLGRPVGIEHHGNTALARCLADRPHEIGKPVVGEQQRRRRRRKRSRSGGCAAFDAAVAIRHDDPFAGRVDHDARHRDRGAGNAHDAAGVDAFPLHRRDQLIAGIVGFVAERAGCSARWPPSRATAIAAFTAQPPQTVRKSWAMRLAAGRRKLVHPKEQILHRDARAQHDGGSAGARRGHGRSRPNRG